MSVSYPVVPGCSVQWSGLQRSDTPAHCSTALNTVRPLLLRTERWKFHHLPLHPFNGSALNIPSSNITSHAKISPQVPLKIRFARQGSDSGLCCRKALVGIVRFHPLTLNYTNKLLFMAFSRILKIRGKRIFLWHCSNIVHTVLQIWQISEGPC